MKEKEGKRERLRGRFSNQLCLDLTIRFFLRLLNECNPLSLSWPQTINTCFVEIFTLMIIVKSNLGQTQGHCTYGYRWMDTLRFALGVEARHCFMKERWERNSLGLLNSYYHKAARWEFLKSEQNRLIYTTSLFLRVLCAWLHNPGACIMSAARCVYAISAVFKEQRRRKQDKERKPLTNLVALLHMFNA